MKDGPGILLDNSVVAVFCRPSLSSLDRTSPTLFQCLLEVKAITLDACLGDELSPSVKLLTHLIRATACER